jgi:hypothetical protein
MTPNNPDYPTCGQTYGTLCITGSDMDPREVTSLLGIHPSKSQIAGEARVSRNGPILNKLSGWFLSTENHVSSKDSRDHIDWLLQNLAEKDDHLIEVQQRGWKTSVSFYWLSLSGHGGPTLSPPQMKRLAELGLEIWFDCYFLDDDESGEQDETQQPP